MDVDIDLNIQEVALDTILQEEANTQEINKIKTGSNKVSIRNDLTKDEMIFSEDSSRNVKLIELKKTSETVQCRSCLKYVFKGTTKCK